MGEVTGQQVRTGSGLSVRALDGTAWPSASARIPPPGPADVAQQRLAGSPRWRIVTGRRRCAGSSPGLVDERGGWRVPGRSVLGHQLADLRKKTSSGTPATLGDQLAGLYRAKCRLRTWKHATAGMLHGLVGIGGRVSGRAPPDPLRLPRGPPRRSFARRASGLRWPAGRRAFLARPLG